ncbi:acyl-CoA thioesterase [Mangrovimonas sp. ST2L15]|uniref:acyl-CoA thioesterase n=1 Tax=Mangrovimonas sp. ST2L15 TaxID=1645916 RepID=UPI0006B4FD22|nr:acyl-CoA thioesterase [Mangrovimonas sp. ST2L15]
MSKHDFKTVDSSKISISELMQPSHSNFGGKIHGGYILNLMDQIAFACASKHSETYCVTASVDTVDFLNPIEIGELVTMKASLNFVGKTSMVVGIRVESENIRTGEVKHCNSSYFTMVAKDDHGNTIKVPGLILNDENEIKRFLKAIKRKETKKHRTEEFNGESFSLNNYLDHLKGYNIKIDLKG